MNTSRFPRRPRHRLSPRPCSPFPQIRHVTVGTLWCRDTSIPWIRLRGHWLRHAGFTPQSLVAVVVMPGRLELTLVAPAQNE